MSYDFCMDCGTLLSDHSRIRPTCGVENNLDENQGIRNDRDYLSDQMDNIIPENLDTKQLKICHKPIWKSLQQTGK